MIRLQKKIYFLLYSKHFYVVIRIGECQFSSSSIRPVDNVFGPLAFVEIYVSVDELKSQCIWNPYATKSVFFFACISPKAFHKFFDA